MLVDYHDYCKDKKAYYNAVASDIELMLKMCGGGHVKNKCSESNNIED